MPLYVVSTPIGNIGDISFRAVNVLKDSELIAAEDTRRTGILLKKYDLKTAQTSYNDFNKKAKTKHLLNLLKEGKSVALVSDSGTPGISDPGYFLIKNCIEEDIDVIPVPGASAAIAALTCSGFPTDSFVFYGFLPKKEGQKKKFLDELEQDKTVILYESPYRLIKTLKLMAVVMPQRNICIARELTKKFEEFIRGKTEEVYKKLKDKKIKGEIVIVVSKNLLPEK